MQIKLPSQGMPRHPSRSYGIIAEKRRNSAYIIQKIAEDIIKNGIVTALWDEKTSQVEIYRICKQQEFDYGDPTFVSAGSIMNALRNLIKLEARRDNN